MIRRKTRDTRTDKIFPKTKLFRARDETILFDQGPRNIWRGHADAFATDSLARAIAHGIVERGWHEAWPDERRQFACLPFQHSEDIGDQRESLRLFGGFDDPMFQDFAKKHFDIVDRFGRFPHPNVALGRAPRRSEEHTSELQS